MSDNRETFSHSNLTLVNVLFNSYVTSETIEDFHAKAEGFSGALQARTAQLQEYERKATTTVKRVCFDAITEGRQKTALAVVKGLIDNRDVQTLTAAERDALMSYSSECTTTLLDAAYKISDVLVTVDVDKASNFT